ncbi:MAG: transporter [Pseudomonadaceae bacterium]|nr:MAG: transporter [Pseudomonadaceae bacterium]
MKLLRFVYSRLTEDLLLLALVLGFALLAVFTPVAWQQLPALVDWHTIAILAGLMVLSRGLEDSGALVRSGHWLLGRMHSERQLALAMVLFAALLSAVITNDVALFIVVPLTLSLGRLASLPVGRLVIFQALAVNAGSAVSPIGNPQNLYLWQRSGDSFFTFMWQMLPIATWMLVALLLLTALVFSARRVDIHTQAAAHPISRQLLRISLVCFPLFLFLVEWGLIAIAVAGVLALYLLCWRRVLQGVDWLILLIFILMFVNLGLLARLHFMPPLVDALLALPGAEITGAVALSQVISNVPATIFLAEFSERWYALAWGANVGGFGLVIGSLANLIALRLGRQPGLWLPFHGWSLIMLLLSLLGLIALGGVQGLQ